VEAVEKVMNRADKGEEGKGVGGKDEGEKKKNGGWKRNEWDRRKKIAREKEGRGKSRGDRMKNLEALKDRGEPELMNKTRDIGDTMDMDKREREKTT
jgi:hypothetical protein